MTAENLKTSDEAAASTLDGTEIVRIVQAGVNKRTTLAEIAALATGGSGGGSDLGWVCVGTDAELVTGVAAINAAANGGVLFVKPSHLTTPGIVLTKPCVLRGSGRCDNRGNNAISSIQCTSLGTSVVDFQADPWAVHDIQLKGPATGTPTAGAGIHSTKGAGHVIDNVFVGPNTFNSIDVKDGSEFFWSKSVCFGPVNYGAIITNVDVPDGGDQSLGGMLFMASGYNALAALHMTSGGGFKLSQFKINMDTNSHHFMDGISIAMANGAVTVDCIISDGSIENLDGTPIKMRTTGSGQLPGIIIKGIQMASYAQAGAVPGIDIDATGGGSLSTVIIDDILFQPGISLDSAAIKLRGVNNVSIGVCRQDGNHKPDGSRAQLLDYDPASEPLVDNVNRLFGTAYESAVTGSFTPDMANYSDVHLHVTGNFTLANPVGYRAGGVVNLTIQQDGTGSRLIGYGTMYQFPSGTAPVLSTAPNAIDELSFKYNGVLNKCILVSVKAIA